MALQSTRSAILCAWEDSKWCADNRMPHCFLCYSEFARLLAHSRPSYDTFVPVQERYFHLDMCFVTKGLLQMLRFCGRCSGVYGHSAWLNGAFLRSIHLHVDVQPFRRVSSKSTAVRANSFPSWPSRLPGADDFVKLNSPFYSTTSNINCGPFLKWTSRGKCISFAWKFVNSRLIEAKIETSGDVHESCYWTPPTFLRRFWIFAN